MMNILLIPKKEDGNKRAHFALFDGKDSSIRRYYYLRHIKTECLNCGVYGNVGISHKNLIERSTKNGKMIISVIKDRFRLIAYCRNCDSDIDPIEDLDIAYPRWKADL